MKIFYWKLLRSTKQAKIKGLRSQKLNSNKQIAPIRFHSTTRRDANYTEIGAVFRIQHYQWKYCTHQEKGLGPHTKIYNFRLDPDLYKTNTDTGYRLALPDRVPGYGEYEEGQREPEGEEGAAKERLHRHLQVLVRSADHLTSSSERGKPSGLKTQGEK